MVRPPPCQALCSQRVRGPGEPPLLASPLPRRRNRPGGWTGLQNRLVPPRAGRKVRLLPFSANSPWARSAAWIGKRRRRRRRHHPMELAHVELDASVRELGEHVRVARTPADLLVVVIV